MARFTPSQSAVAVGRGLSGAGIAPPAGAEIRAEMRPAGRTGSNAGSATLLSGNASDTPTTTPQASGGQKGRPSEG